MTAARSLLSPSEKSGLTRFTRGQVIEQQAHRPLQCSEVAHAINLKFAPEIRFLADDSFDEASRIDQLLMSEKVRRDVIKVDSPEFHPNKPTEE